MFYLLAKTLFRLKSLYLANILLTWYILISLVRLPQKLSKFKTIIWNDAGKVFSLNDRRFMNERLFLKIWRVEVCTLCHFPESVCRLTKRFFPRRFKWLFWIRVWKLMGRPKNEKWVHAIFKKYTFFDVIKMHWTKRTLKKIHNLLFTLYFSFLGRPIQIATLPDLFLALGYFWLF